MSDQTLTRRKFLNALWAALGVAAVAESIAVVSRYLKPREQRSAPSQPDPIVVAGPVNRFEPGTVQAFVQGKFYLARLEDGGFLALSRNCTHLNCTVPWVAGEDRFVCPCHASAFDIRGDVISPPAPRALDRFDVEIVNGVVRVDTGKRHRRSAFEASQATYPET